jgi:hypothetical protein
VTNSSVQQIQKIYVYAIITNCNINTIQGGSRGGAPGAGHPNIGKNMIFLRKIVTFHTKYPKNFRASPPSAIGKNDFLA